MITDYQGKQITVMGLGRFGGGVGVARFLAERGADVLVTDTLPAEELKDSIAQLADLAPGSGDISYRLGEHNVSDFTTCDMVVVNPAVKPDNRFVRAARAAGIPVTSEIRLLVKHLPNRLRTIGITGSAGKSTTTAMTAHILAKVLPGGLLSRPLASGSSAFSDPPPSREGLREGAGSQKTSAHDEPLVPAPSPQPPPSREGGQGQVGRSPGVWMGGNIGGSLLPFVEDIRDDDWVVLELSSFMLEGLREDEWSPHIAVITNISPNHLDWHGSMEKYVAAKHAVLDYQTPEDIFVFGPGVKDSLLPPRGLQDGAVHDWPACDDDITPFFDESIRSPLPGRHNQVNAEIAAEACGYTGFSLSDQIDAAGRTRSAIFIQDFHGLPHRLEYVGEFNGVKCYNDSKSTTPEAAGLAIESFDVGKVRIILGGYDKGSDFGELAALAAGRCAGVYTIGVTGEGIADLIAEHMRAEARTPKGLVVERCGTLAVAVERAMRDARQGEVVVLSPGCASWDQFANYEERGARFIELVKGYNAG